MFIVILAHLFQKYQLAYGELFGLENFYWVSIGGVGVTLLIILSGAALHYNYRNKGTSYHDFIFKRLTRIYPTYWLAIFFTLILLGFSLAQKSITNLLLDISGFLVFTGTTWDNYILPMGWFIGLIVTLYFFYPLLKKLFVKFNPIVILTILLFIEIVARIITGRYVPGYRPLDWMPFCRLFEFGLGIYLVENTKTLAAVRRVTISRISGLTAWLDKISFPAYLIHYPILELSAISSDNIYVFSVKLFVITLVFSYAIYSVDKIIQRFLHK